MQRSFIFVLLLFSLAGCRQAPPPAAPANAALDHLLEKMDERLALMEGVAKYKRSTGKPIADPDREAALLRKLEEKANARQIDPSRARRFFAAQIQAAKILQENHLGSSRTDGPDPSNVPVIWRKFVNESTPSTTIF